MFLSREHLKGIAVLKQDKHFNGPEGEYSTKSNVRGTEALGLFEFGLCILGIQRQIFVYQPATFIRQLAS